MKKLISLVLVLAMFCSLLPAAVFAAEPEQGESVVLTKTLIPASGGRPDQLKLEAYVTGSTVSTTTTKPTDIILVLDQSGSMDETVNNRTKLSIMRSAVTTFVSNVAELNEGRDSDSLHRVAVVGFASESGYSDNTEILTATKDVTVTSTEYRVVTGDLDTDHTYYIRRNEEYRRISYQSGWNSGWYTSGWGSSRVDVDSVTVYERVNVTTTQPSVGVAYNDLTVEDHYSNALVDCTDAAIASTGIIGQAIAALDGNGATRADLGLEMAADIFDAQPAGTYGSNGREQVVVFLTDGNPTSWQDFDTGIANDAVAAAAGMKNDGAHIFSLYLGNPGNNAVSFMQAVSSNYPEATAYNRLGTQAATTYYSAHSDSAAITDVFTQIVNSINAHTTLTEQAVISDSISPYFTLASGADTHSIRVYTVECTGYSNGEYTWADTENAFSAAAVSISGKTIQVTNFNFPYHCVTQSNKSSTPGTTDFGRKLVIYVPIIEDSSTDSFGGYLPTNAGAGIYKTGASGEDPVVTAPGRYDDVSINYSLNAAERLTHLGLENSLTMTLTEYLATESNGQTMLEEAITRLPNGVNNAGVTMTYYLIDPGTNAGFGGSGSSDDTILASLTVEAGDTMDVTDFDNWTMADGINAEDTVTLTIPDDGNNMAEKVLILACRLTSTKEVQTPDTALYYSNLDYIITNSESFVVYGEIDQGGTLEVTDANNDGVITGTVFGNTYTEAVPYTETPNGIMGGNSDRMTFSTLPGYEIENILKLTKNAAGEDVPQYIYSAADGTATLTSDETLDPVSGVFTAQVTNIQTDTAYEVHTRLKQFTLVTEHDSNTHIDAGHTYAYDAQNPLQVWFHATDGSRITALLLTETDGSIAFYTAQDLLAMTASELADLGLSLVTADGYDANGNAVTVITGGNVSLPKTQNNYVAVAGAARYYKLTYVHYIENGSENQPFNPWNIPDDVAANLADGASIPAEAKHTQVSYVAYGDTLTYPPLRPGSHRTMISDGVQYTFRGAFDTYTGTEFTNYVDLVNEQGVITHTMPAHDEEYYGFWEKDPNVAVNLGTITKVLNKSHTEDQTFTFVAMFHEREVGKISVNVPAGSTEAVTDALTVTLTAAQQTRFQSGDKIYIYEVEDAENSLWLYDNTRYELSYGDEGITIAVSGTGAAAEKVVFTNRQKAPALSVEKTLISEPTAEVGDTITWQIVVSNSGTAAGKFQLADKLNGNDLSYTTNATAENGWYSIPADSEISFDVSYTVQPEDAGQRLINVAVLTPEDEEPEEDPADPVVVDGFTVTYTDGVENEEVFGDKMESGLQYNDDTPKFDEDNTPVRDGYIFTGWTPTWQDKVTGNVVYAATWTAAVSDLSVEKTLTSELTAEVGDTITWQIVVTNSGTAAGKFQLADELNGENLTYTTNATADNSWYTIPADSEITFDVSYTVQPEDAGQRLINVAVLTPEDGDPQEDPADPVVVDTYSVTYTDGVENEEVFGDKMESGLQYNDDTPKYDEDNTPVRDGYVFSGWTPTWQDKVTGNVVYTATWTAAVSDLSVEKTLTSEPTAEVGDTITWQIVVTNSGTAAGKFQLTDKLNGENLTYTTNATADNSWYTIPADSEITFDVSYTVQPEDAGQRLINVAVLTPEDGDPQEDPADPVVVDTYSVTYTDGVENEEVFGDKMESGLQYNDDTPKYDEDNTPVRDGYTFTGWTPTWQDKVTGNVVYTANWRADNHGITVTKTLLGSDKVTPGDTVKWEIEVTNSGNTTLHDIRLEDRMPGASGTVILLDASGKELSNNFTFDLAVGTTRVFTAQYTVRLTDIGKTLKNVVVASNENTSDEGESKEICVRIPSIIGGIPSLNADDHFAYIVGYADGTVRPNSKITRAETATIFFRLLTDADRAYYWSKTNPYTDVTSTDWFNNAISTLTNANILEGMTATTFLPNEPITRAQFATMAARFSDVVYTSGSTFTDVPDNHWAARYIALAQHLGYVDGYPDGTFRPDQHITRAEAMTLINRVLERAVEPEYMLPDMIHWPDNPTTAWYYEAVQEATNSHYYKRTRVLVPNQSFYYEYWTDIIPAPDWEALERSWSDAGDVKRG